MQIREARRMGGVKTAEKMENKQRPGFRRQKERESKKERVRRSEGVGVGGGGGCGMRMPIKVGNWSPLLLSIPLVPIFP